MQYLSANCIIPSTGPPAYNSVLAVSDNGDIDGVYKKNELKEHINEIVHYNGILCPGFVNTHCHLELSWAKGLIPESEGLDYFVRRLETLRTAVSPASIQHAIVEAASDMHQSGIVAIADIANGNHTLDYKQKSRQYFRTFVEVFGSNPAYARAIFEKAQQIKSEFETHTSVGKASLVPHATYSLSLDLFRLLAAAAKEDLISIHHQENNDENLFFLDGSGPIAERRKAFNPGMPVFSGTGKRPMESIARYFDPGQKLILVHNTVSGQQDIDFVQGYFNQAYWCFCPNANLYIEGLLPNIPIFSASNCKITLGTDSLASNRQLSIFEEIKTIQKHFPEIPLAELIQWGTLNGAECLGLVTKLGSFEKGKTPGVVLIENIDTQTLQLNSGSTSRLIIPAAI